MKKWILLGIVILIAIYLSFDRSSVYYFADNVNGYYDELYDVMDSMPFSTTSLVPSKDKITALKNVKGVKEVYPYLPLKSYLEEDWRESSSQITVNEHGQSRLIQLPLNIGFENEIHYLTSIEPRAYGSEEDLLDMFTPVIHYQGCDSGIFINQEVYQALKISDTSTQVSLTVSFYVPVTAKNTLHRFSTPRTVLGEKVGKDEYDFYAEVQEITGYQEVTYTFDIEGIIEGGWYLNYPAELSEKLFALVNQNDVELKEDEHLWEPTYYVICLENKMTINSLANRIDQVMDKFAIQEEYETDGREEIVAK